jgi:hypothetical protein
MNIYGGGKLLNTFDRVKYRKINDDEIKALFEKIKLNTDYPLPEKLVQDFINDGSIEPTHLKCTNFKNHHFNQLIIHIKKRKNIKKVPSKPNTKRNKKGHMNDTSIYKKNKINKTKKVKKVKKVNNVKRVKKTKK